MRIIFQKKGGGIFGALIRWWTKSAYCHCEIVFTDGARFTASPFIGTRYLPELHPTQEKDWDSFPMFLVTMEEEQKIRKFCNDELNCKYDWTGILFSHVFKMGWEDSEHWFCSEICAAALNHVGAIRIGKDRRPASFSPEKLYRFLRG
jgi:hypothetical protein